ncbi:MAG TPA: DinB family protein [Candidatus Krumholzibacteria bacterium]|nr:DinB family protein [Candidatus Krumholzibacteria bacterium]
MSSDMLRDQLLTMLQASNAHPMLKEIVQDFPPEHYGTLPEGFNHSAWQLLEHLRLAQEDILKFSTDPNYESPPWPEGYWPKNQAPRGEAQWSASVEDFQRNLKSMMKLVADESKDLQEPLAQGDGQTLLREAILLIKHNSYHFGQLMLLKRYFENKS